MAEAKGTKTKKAKPKKAAAKRAGAKAKSGARKATGRSGGSKSANGASASGNGGGAAAKASRNGSEAGSTVGAVAEKAKLPLLATGAVVAGAAAVIATKGAGHKQRKVLGVPVPKRSKSHMPKVSVPKVSVPKIGMPKGKGLKGDVRRAAGTVSDVAKQADQIGKRISRVANSVQAVGEATDDAAKKS